MFGEDEEFIPGPSSNLASLFDKRLTEDGNLSLIYTAPKQPKVQVKSSKPSSASSNLVDLILFKSVEAYKLENGAYQNHGKTGVAVLGNEETRLYQILLYRDKLHHLCTAKINLQFKFLIQAKNYATFYDKHNQVWSVLFANDEDAIEFSIQIALAKYNSEEKGCLISQDLLLPPDGDKGTMGNIGDTVEFQYTLYDQGQLNKLKQLQKNNSGKMCAKVDTSGWEQELQNIYKGSQRLIIIPSENLGDWKSVVPTSPVLIVKLTTTKVINALTEFPQLPQIREKMLKPVPLDNPEFSSGEVTVKSFGPSIKDALSSSPRAAKASLISRMARMGQATLPVTATSATPSDSDETEEDQSIRMKRQFDTRPELKPRIRNNQNIVQNISPTTALMNTAQTTWQPYMMGHMIPQVISSPNDASLPVFFSEVRTHNSELRMGITRVSDKVDNLLTKLDNRTDKIGNDETLLSRVDKLSQENFSLKKQLEGNCQQLQDQNKEILNILSRFKAAEPLTCIPNGLSNVDEDKSKKLESLLEEREENLSRLREQLSEQQKHNKELKFQLKTKEDEFEKMIALNERHTEGSREIEHEDNILKEKYEKKISEMNNYLRNAEKEMSILKENCEKEITKVNEKLVKGEKEMSILKEDHEKKIALMNEKLVKAEKEMFMLKEDHEKEIAKINNYLRIAENEALTLKENYGKEITELTLALKNQVDIMNKLKEENEASVFIKEELEKVLLQKRIEIDELATSLQKHNVIIKELKTRLVQEKGKTDSSEDIKTVMNIVYRHLKAQFQQDVMYSTASIQAVLIETIKTVTYQYLQSDSILKGDASKLQKKLSVNPHPSETKIVTAEKPTLEEKAVDVEVQSETKVQLQDNSEIQSENIIPGEYKTKEERDQMKLSLEPTKSHSSTDKKVISVSEHNVPVMPTDQTEGSETVVTDDKGDCESSSQKIEVSKESDVKPSRGPQGDDDDSADDLNLSPFQLPPRLWLPNQQVLLENLVDNPPKIEFFKMWQPQPPPPPLFDDDDNEDDWFNT